MIDDRLFQPNRRAVPILVDRTEPSFHHTILSLVTFISASQDITFLSYCIIFYRIVSYCMIHSHGTQSILNDILDTRSFCGTTELRAASRTVKYFACAQHSTASTAQFVCMVP